MPNTIIRPSKKNNLRYNRFKYINMEEFVNFKISSKLRAKGFNVECSHYYWVENKNLYKGYPSQDWNQKRDKYSAPNISQVLDWLREEKKNICMYYTICNTRYY